MMANDQTAYSLSVVIPVYNEADNVETLFQEIMDSLAKTAHTYEIVFVDDGSQDRTLERLQELKKLHPEHLIVVAHRKNFGQSAGLISGAKAARNSWIVTLDGDGQNDPADIALLFNELQKAKKNTVIFGNRRQRNDSTIRKLSSRIGNGVRQWLLKDNCSDTGCSLKLFPRDVFLELPRFDHMHRFLPALFKRAGFEIINVPVNHRPRLHGVSKYGIKNRLWTGIVDLTGVLWLLHRPCQPEVKQFKECT